MTSPMHEAMDIIKAEHRALASVINALMHGQGIAT